VSPIRRLDEVAFMPWPLATARRIGDTGERCRRRARDPPGRLLLAAAFEGVTRPIRCSTGSDDYWLTTEIAHVPA
jgi:hypothetical protein